MDLFYSVILFLLVAALVLGSFVVKQVSHGNYPLALAQTLFAIALLLIALSWLWNPHGGFAGLGHILSRYLMSLGLPFEQLGAAAGGVRGAGNPAAALSRAGARAHARPAVGDRAANGRRASARASTASSRATRRNSGSRTCG